MNGRFRGCLTNGELLPIPDVLRVEVALGVLLHWRRSDSLELWSQKVKMTGSKWTNMPWCLTKTAYGMREIEGPCLKSILEIPPEVGVPGDTIGSENVRHQRLNEREQIEVEITANRITVIVIGDGKGTGLRENGINVCNWSAGILYRDYLEALALEEIRN